MNQISFLSVADGSPSKAPQTFSSYVQDSPEGGTHLSFAQNCQVIWAVEFQASMPLQAQPSFPPKQAIIPENRLVRKFSQNSLSKMEGGHKVGNENIHKRKDAAAAIERYNEANKQ